MEAPQRLPMLEKHSPQTWLLPCGLMREKCLSHKAFDSYKLIDMNLLIIDRIIVAAALLAVALIGFVRKTIHASRALKEYEFTCDFREQLHKYLHFVFGHTDKASEAESAEALGFLLRNSYKMQGMLGGYGVMDSFKPPYSNMIYHRYDVILNVIPEIESITHRFPLGSVVRDNGLRAEYAKLVDNTLIRYEGVLEDRIKILCRQRWNPVIMLRDGIEALLLPVFYLFLWFGLISRSTIETISHSYFFKLLSFVFFILGAVGTVMTIALGWSEFWSMAMAMVKIKP